MSDGPFFIAHRGFDLCHPENTMFAFGRVLESSGGPVRGIELDVRLTRDRQVVVFHDANLWRLAGRWHRIAGTGYPALRHALQDNPRFHGHHIPLLAELLASVGHSLLVNIELKHHRGDPAPLCRELAAILQEYRPQGDVIVSGFSAGALQAAQEALRGLTVRFGFLFSSLRRTAAFAAAVAAADCLHPAHKLLVTHGAFLRRTGKPLFPWTVNTLEEMKIMERSSAWPLVEGVITGNSRLAESWTAQK